MIYLERKLDATQRVRRQPGVYPLIYSVDKKKSDIPSYFRDHYQSFMNSLVKQYRVDESILDYNLYRFSHCFQLFANDLIRQHHQAIDYFLLNNEQKQYAFEFYLQIDGKDRYIYISILIRIFSLSSGPILYENVFLSSSSSAFTPRISFLCR